MSTGTLRQPISTQASPTISKGLRTASLRLMAPITVSNTPAGISEGGANTTANSTVAANTATVPVARSNGLLSNYPRILVLGPSRPTNICCCYPHKPTSGSTGRSSGRRQNRHQDRSGPGSNESRRMIQLHRYS